MGDIETDFIPVMAFMASDGSKFMTGQTISIDGGIMMVR
jgi:NAD(P)-dependent dehydrogenase (short-subunit alcohol dehydrogenase family)